MLPTNTPSCKIELTQAAWDQIKLMIDNDYTLEGLSFRLKIGGKGCDGFTYSTGFSIRDKDDTELDYAGLKILIDPFTLHYCNEGRLDYLLNPTNNEDGFVFINDNESKYQGKFFKDESMAPTHLEKK